MDWWRTKSSERRSPVFRQRRRALEKTFIGRVVAGGTGALALPFTIMSAPGTASGAGPVVVEPTTPNSHVHSQKAHTMSDQVTRAEMEAHLKAVKAESVASNAGLQGKVEAVLSAISHLSEKVDTRIGHLDEKISSAVDGVKDDNKTTRRVTLVTIILSVLAAIAAIYAAQANNIAAMQVGIEATRDAMAAQLAAPAAPVASATGGDGT